MKLVVDASVTLKWLLQFDPNEQDVGMANSVLLGIEAGRHTMFQPHRLAEVLAVMARRNPSAIESTLCFLEALPVAPTTNTAIYSRAALFAIHTKQHLFDTLYHAVAIELAATYITADERYYGAAHPLGAIVRLADFTDT